MKRLWLLGLLLVPALSGAAEQYAPIRGGSFHSVMPEGKEKSAVVVAPFRLDKLPVTNAEFAAFVKRYPQWRRGAAPEVFADGQFLAHWSSADAPAAGSALQPVTHVSWFAAQAYCEARSARLPTWHEWELAAAADEQRLDAREDPAWRQRILDWYARPATGELSNVGSTPANLYGVRDLHGVMWEWVEDHSALMVSGDNREQGDPDLLKFCGAGALTMEQKENYAVLMRIAMLSSLRGADTTTALGFRCAKDGLR